MLFLLLIAEKHELGLISQSIGLHILSVELWKRDNWRYLVTDRDFEVTAGNNIDLTCGMNDALNCTAYRVVNIPSDNLYYVPEDCRFSTILNELAVIGDRIFVDKHIDCPTNLATESQSSLRCCK
jgi:hypothetical protein